MYGTYVGKNLRLDVPTWANATPTDHTLLAPGRTQKLGTWPKESQPEEEEGGGPENAPPGATKSGEIKS